MNLNPAQKRAAEHTTGPLEIVAGPGTGKTRTLIARAEHLVKLGVNPRRIALITFTNKAAREIMARLSEAELERGVIGLSEVHCSTFHSLGLRLLTRADHHFNGILDRRAAVDLLTEIVETHQQEDKDDFTREELKNTLEFDSRFREMGRHHEPAPVGGNSLKEYQKLMKELKVGLSFTQLSELLPLYERYKTDRNVYDFTDLLYWVVYDDEGHPAEQFANLFAYVMVDEAHDMNHLQLLMAMEVAQDDNICVVYDDDQSIYEWRGATPKNIGQFRMTYQEATRIRLDVNYRNPSEIHTAAENLISYSNQRLNPDKTYTLTKVGGSVDTRLYDSPKAEAEGIARLIQGRHYAPSKTAVLYRTNIQGLVIERALRMNGVPATFAGHTVPFYRQEATRAAVAYLQLLVNPQNDHAMQIVLNVPKRGVGTRTRTAILNKVKANQSCIFDVMKSGDFKATRDCKASLGILAGYIKHYSDRAKKTTKIDEIRDYLTCIFGGSLADDRDIAAMTCSIIEDIRYYMESNDDASLEEYALTAMLAGETSSGEDNCVQLMTIHASKGLEFDNVFVAGLEDGTLPWITSGVEEERRLLYVAITRCSDTLHLSSCRHKPISLMTWADERRPSRFLREVRCERPD